MFSQETPEQIIQKQEKQIQELEIRMEQLQSHVSKLFEEVGISPEKLDSALQKSDLFSPEEWEEVQKQKEEIDARIEAEHRTLTNPKDSARSRHEQRELERHWIYVK